MANDSTVQIIPFYAQPHVHTVINDDTFYDETTAPRTESDDLPFATCIVTGADRGIDNKFVRVNTKTVKDAIFGKANFAKYGQASIQADVLFNGKTDVWFCRALPDNATYANLIMVANFRKGKILNDLNQETGLSRLEIKFSTAYATKPYVTEGATSDAVINQVATSLTKLTADAQDGYLTLPLFYVRPIGRGKYGNEYSMSISRDTEAENDYGMKMYMFNLLSNTNVTRVINQFSGSLYQTTKYNTSTLISDVLDQFPTGSCPVSIVPFEDNWETLYNFYANIVAENASYLTSSNTKDEQLIADLKAAQAIAVDSFDPIFGLKLNTRTAEKIPYYRNYTKTVANAWADPDYVVTEETDWQEQVDDGDVVSINGINYSSVKDAIAAVEPGGTIKFVADMDMTETLYVNKDVTLDLNGKTLSFPNDQQMFVYNGTVTVRGGTITQALNDQGTSKYAAIQVGASNADGQLILEDTKVAGYYGVLPVGSGSHVTVKSGVTFECSGFGIATNGSAAAGQANVTIEEGTVINGNGAGIYLPSGTLTVNGGSITGGTGIMVRGGTLYVKGGTITGTSTNNSKLGDAGYSIDDAAIIIDKHKSYNNGHVSATITGGTIIGVNKAILYTENGVACGADCAVEPNDCTKCQKGIEGISISGAKITGTVICEKYPKGNWETVTNPTTTLRTGATPIKAVAKVVATPDGPEINTVNSLIAKFASNIVSGSAANEDIEASNREKKPTNISIWNEAFVGARVMVYADPLHDGQRYMYTITAIEEDGKIIYDEGEPVAIDAEQFTGLNISLDVGHMFSGGSDGDFQEITVDGVTRAPTSAEMKLLLSKEYVRIFRGEKDRKILSPARVNLDFMYDANYNMTTDDTLETSGTTDIFSGNTVLTDADNQSLSAIGGSAISMNFTDLNVKKAMYDLNEFRNKNGMTINPAMGAGCSLYLDCNLTGLKSISVSYELMNIINAMADMDGRATSIDLGFYEIFDPVSSKRIKVTPTYFIAKNLVPHLVQNGLNKPFTNTFARMRAYQRDNTLSTSGDMIRDSFRPDIDLIDWDVKEALYNSRLNYWISSKEGRIVQRATQNTRQLDASALLEENNVRVLNTLKKGLEAACQNYLYDWNTPEARKGYTTAQMDIYRPWIGTMVEDLEIKFEANEWEQNRMIMHCYCIVKFRDIVKRIILEINIQRPTYSLESE